MTLHNSGNPLELFSASYRMLDAEGSCTSENGDLSFSQSNSMNVNLNSPHSVSLQRYVSAPEFVCRKPSYLQLYGKPIVSEKESKYDHSFCKTYFIYFKL